MDIQTGAYTEDYMAQFMDKLFASGECTAYTAVRYNIRGMGNINDQLGMDTGTALMRAYVQGLQDLVGTRGIVVRKGGDTFTSIFPTEQLDDVMVYLTGKEVVTEDVSVHRYISSHAGYYRITENCHSIIELNDILDEALRIARNHVDSSLYAFCDDEVLQKVSESRKIEGMFRGGIENEEFQVYYQPKVELKRYRMKGAEALCRWVHEGEMILPFKFIPVFENNGDICELDFYMIDHVCRDMRRWLDEGKQIVRTSINLSREHMGDRHLLEHILEIIDRHNVPHKYIEIELTETSTDVDYMELKQIVVGLHEAGIHTSVDDFGVGYSSMNLLVELPWNMVKIDKSIVPLGTGDEEDEKKLIMLRSLVTMAQGLGLECIAEGVETIEQVILLKENQCYYVQGFYFDRPLPVEDFEKRIDVLTEIVGKYGE